MDLSEWADRPRGVLTKKERRYLLSQIDEDGEDTEEAIRQREYRIRKHLRHALIDFQLLATAYDRRLEGVFEDLVESENIYTSDDPLRNGIKGVFTLLYRALSGLEPEEGLVDKRFSALLGRGVNEAVHQIYARHHMSVSPSPVLFMVHGTEPAVPLEKIKESYDQGEFLLLHEVEDLYFGGYLTYKEYQSYDALTELENPAETIEEREATREELAIENAPTRPEYL